MFCINVHIDEMLMSEKNKALGINTIRIISLCYSWKDILVSDSCLAKYWRNLFVFCIKVEIDEMLLLVKNNGLGVNFL